MPKKIFGYAERPTSRLMSRLVAEFHLGCARDAIAALRDVTSRPARLDHAIVMLVVLRLSETLTLPPEVEIMDLPGGGISINAIAASLHRPFETVRRHVNLLLAGGVLMRSAHGVTISDAARDGGAIRRLRDQMHDRLVLLIDTLAGLTVPLPASRADARYDPAVTIAASIDLYLSGIEFIGPHYPTWLDMVVVNLVIAASIRHITCDAVLAWRYADADTLPPPHLRHFIDITPLAASFGISRTTMRRHLAEAIARGALEGTPQRARASEDYLGGPVVKAGGTALAARATQVLARLGSGGFDYGRPGDHYLAERPERIPACPARRPIGEKRPRAARAIYP